MMTQPEPEHACNPSIMANAPNRDQSNLGPPCMGVCHYVCHCTLRISHKYAYILDKPALRRGGMGQEEVLNPSTTVPTAPQTARSAKGLWMIVQVVIAILHISFKQDVPLHS